MNRKITQLFLIFGLSTMLVYSCKDNKKGNEGGSSQINPWDTISDFKGLIVPSEGAIQVNFSYSYGNSPIEFDSKNYVNAAGDTFTINELRHYLSNVTLIKAGGGEVNLKNYDLLNAEIESLRSFTLKNVPAGNYTGFKVNIGVDSEANHNGLQEGALDPANGMFWTWNTGYIFYRINGNTSRGKSYSLDLGGDANLPVCSVDFSTYKVKSKAPVLSLKMDVNEMFQNPSVYSFEADGYLFHDPSSPNGPKLKSNMEDMITVTDLVQ